MNQDISYLTLADRKLAYQQRSVTQEKCAKAGIIFLGGLASDMSGTKATFLDAKCAAAGLAFTRFDYRGHGASSDEFIDGCIGEWADDALKVFDSVTTGPQILVGSSMGGWIGLLMMREKNTRIAGFVGVAAAPDFTEELIAPALTEAQKKDLAEKGMMYEDEALEGQGIPITRKLMEDGRDHLVLGSKIEFDGPVHLIQGQADKEVPWRFSLKVAEGISSENMSVTLVKSADHRMSRDQDLDLLWRVIEGMVEG